VRSNGVTEQVHLILKARNRGADLRPDLPLGAGGLGLDSIALVEVLLECEDRFGVTMAAELLERPSLTVGLLVERIETMGRP